jgi:FtsZ-binding cell division protein ZapB
VIASADLGVVRLKFEADHLQDEVQEIKKLIDELLVTRESLLSEQRLAQEELYRVNEGLSATRRRAASIVVPNVTPLEMDIGRFAERIRQLRRIQSLLDAEKEMSATISRLENEIADHQTAVDHLTAHIDYSEAANFMSSEMYRYLSALNDDRANAWSLQGRLRWKIRRNSFDVTIGDNKWSTKVGGTLTLYFLLAYHYALFSMSNFPHRHYPGIAILDLPAKLDDGTVIRDQENFILTPFIHLLSQPAYSNCQLIVAGAAFENLEHVNRISFKNVWT